MNMCGTRVDVHEYHHFFWLQWLATRVGHPPLLADLHWCLWEWQAVQRPSRLCCDTGLAVPGKQHCGGHSDDDDDDDDDGDDDDDDDDDDDLDEVVLADVDSACELDEVEIDDVEDVCGVDMR